MAPLYHYTLCLCPADPESQDVWLEIHKLPRDAWVSEIDAVLTQIKKEAEKREQKQEQGKVCHLLCNE